MKLLLDTQAFLWWIGNDTRLSERARTAIGDDHNEIFFSAASGWEIAVKARLGRVTMPDDAERFVAEQLETNRFRMLPIESAHAFQAQRLPPHHDDPFDRMLVAQALAERMPLVSDDERLEPYGVDRIW
ncbi:MAG: type II toxin-antitoxin system VapC family toxin [Proteobacteria bacterium]|nr:type II toxin-antitoxin system VapC family toxin [Pseudomonadota bacterium]